MWTRLRLVTMPYSPIRKSHSARTYGIRPRITSLASLLTHLRDLPEQLDDDEHDRRCDRGPGDDVQHGDGPGGEDGSRRPQRQRVRQEPRRRDQPGEAETEKRGDGDGLRDLPHRRMVEPLER